MTWETFIGHRHLRPSIEAQVAHVRDHGARFVVVDVSGAKGVPSDEDQAWFAETVFPQYKTHGLAALVTVLPKSAITKLGASRWNRSASGFGFELAEVASLDDARALIAEKKAA